MRATGGAVLVTLLLASAHGSGAQDSTVAVRHPLPLDTSRVQPFRRTYDILVHTRDSIVVLGQREVVLSAATYAGAPAWLFVETRTGVVPSIESLYVAPSLRPIHWSSALGAARLGVEFVGDSIYGASTAPGGRRNIVLAGRPDLLISGAMAEAFLPLLPLAPAWTDSVGIFAADASTSTILPAELVVVGEENLMVDSTMQRPAWVVALRWGTESVARSVLYWIDKETGAALRIEQPLPAHVGTLLQFRMHAETATPPPP
jgi:hypothetical protein